MVNQGNSFTLPFCEDANLRGIEFPLLSALPLFLWLTFDCFYQNLEQKSKLRAHSSGLWPATNLPPWKMSIFSHLPSTSWMAHIMGELCCQPSIQLRKIYKNLLHVIMTLWEVLGLQQWTGYLPWKCFHTLIISHRHLLGISYVQVKLTQKSK